MLGTDVFVSLRLGSGFKWIGWVLAILLVHSESYSESRDTVIKFFCAIHICCIKTPNEVSNGPAVSA